VADESFARDSKEDTGESSSTNVGSALTLQDAIQAAQDKEEEIKRMNSDINKILDEEVINNSSEKNK
jgi:hypothetical protein